MNEISTLNEKGGKGTTKVQGGKTYTNVSTRVEVFRKHLGLEYGIEAAPLFPMNGGIFMQAWVKNAQGMIIGTGHAYATSVSKEKGIEKLETTAIGRALASLGLAGGEYASDTEMESWAGRYDEKGIHMEMGEDDVSPESFLKSKLEALSEWVTKPKSTLEKLVAWDEKTQNDPIFNKLNDPQKLLYSEAVKEAEHTLKGRQ